MCELLYYYFKNYILKLYDKESLIHQRIKDNECNEESPKPQPRPEVACRHAFNFKCEAQKPCVLMFDMNLRHDLSEGDSNYKNKSIKGWILLNDTDDLVVKDIGLSSIYYWNENEAAVFDSGKHCAAPWGMLTGGLSFLHKVSLQVSSGSWMQMCSHLV